METDKVLPGTYKTLPVDPSPDPEIHAVSKNEPGDYADSGANKSENDGSTSSGDDSFESLSYEEAMSKYGSGRYQVIIFILLSLVTFSCVFNNNGYIFIGATQEHYCKVPESSNWTDFNNKTAVLVYTADMCTYNKWARYGDEVDGNITEVMIEEGIKCYSWVYDKSFFDLTVMSEWDINSCTGKWKIALASSMYMLGFLIGCIFLADLSDRYGRSKLLLVSNICMVVIGVIASFSVNFWMLAIMRLLLGIFTAGARNAGFVYVCEIIKERSAAGMLHGVTYSIGGVAVTAIAHLFPHWRHFQLACALCYILYIPYYWIMEESPRWLLSQGRTEEALAYFKKSARINKVEFPENLHVYLEYQPKVEGNALSLFKTPNLRHKSLVVCTLWFSVSIVFFGMTFNAGNLAGNIFTNNYLLQASGILEFFGIWYIRLGRRLAISSAFLIACLVSAVIPIFATYGMQAGVITMSMVGKLFIETNFEMIYVVTAELYPTTARVTALGLGSSIARAGGALSPYLILSDDVWKSLPYVIFGVIALAAGLVATLLPETMNKELPDSLHQVETENLVNHVLCRVKQTTEKEDEEEKTMETVAV